MSDGAFPSPREAIHGGASASFITFLAIAAMGGGLYIATQRADRPPAKSADTLAQIAALARAEKDNEWLQVAIRERQAIVGMTPREVEKAKGHPQRKQRGDELSENLRAKGGVENWIYDADHDAVSSVLFGPKGLVIHSTDVDGKTGPGHAIRQ